MKLELWTLIPALMLLTSMYTVIPHMNYSWTEWALGNSLVSVLMGCVYLGEFSYKKMRDYPNGC